MNITNASWAFYAHKKRPKWAKDLKCSNVIDIDSVINSQAGIKQTDSEREWGNLCRLLMGAKRIHARGGSIYGERNLREYLEHIGPQYPKMRCQLSVRDKLVLRLLRRLRR